MDTYVEFATKSDPLKFPKENENNQGSVYFWWRRNGERFPNVASQMRSLMSIKISSVASERCFSKASILFRNSLRNGLSKELAADLVAIQTGLADRILKNAIGNWEEEDENVEEFDDNVLDMF